MKNKTDAEGTAEKVAETLKEDLRICQELIGRCDEKLAKAGFRGPDDTTEVSVDRIIEECLGLKAAGVNDARTISELTRALSFPGDASQVADDALKVCHLIEELPASELQTRISIMASGLRANILSLGKKTGGTSQRLSAESRYDDHGRQMWVMSGAIVLPNGERIVLRNLESYAPGGDCAITFKGMGGTVIGQWSAPGSDGKQPHPKTYSQADREKHRDAVLAQFDEIFDALS